MIGREWGVGFERARITPRWDVHGESSLLSSHKQISLILAPGKYSLTIRGK